MNSNSASLAVRLPRLKQLPWFERRLVDRLARLRRGTLQLHIAGHALSLRGHARGPVADMRIERPAALLRRILWRGDLGLAEAYIAGEWTSRDPAVLLQLFAENLDAYAASDRRHRLAQILIGLQHRLNRNNRRGSRRNIAAHYDLGNDFYAQWLDPGMTYSAAHFNGTDSLFAAQTRKYERMLALIDPLPGQTILEIGCGWGGFAEYAARRGLRVIGLSLSRQQISYARRRIADAGLADQVDLRLCDYRDFDEPIDHVVSIEMFEAVGREYWESYFANLARCLRHGGRAALQVITIDEQRFDQYAANPGGFIQTYIFPGGMLPTQTHLRDLGQDAGLALRDTKAFGHDYADTLAHWQRAFNAHTEWLDSHGYDERFRRMWRYYLAFCEAGFRARHIDVVQCVLQKD